VKKPLRKKTHPPLDVSCTKKFWEAEDVADEDFDSSGSEYVPGKGEEEEDEEEYVEEN